jgi:hypothetical protein
MLGKLLYFDSAICGVLVGNDVYCAAVRFGQIKKRPKEFIRSKLSHAEREFIFKGAKGMALESTANNAEFAFFKDKHVLFGKPKISKNSYPVKILKDPSRVEIKRSRDTIKFSVIGPKDTRGLELERILYIFLEHRIRKIFNAPLDGDKFRFLATAEASLFGLYEEPLGFVAGDGCTYMLEPTGGTMARKKMLNLCFSEMEASFCYRAEEFSFDELEFFESEFDDEKFPGVDSTRMIDTEDEGAWELIERAENPDGIGSVDWMKEKFWLPEIWKTPAKVRFDPKAGFRFIVETSCGKLQPRIWYRMNSWYGRAVQRLSGKYPMFNSSYVFGNLIRMNTMEAVVYRKSPGEKINFGDPSFEVTKKVEHFDDDEDTEFEQVVYIFDKSRNVYVRSSGEVYFPGVTICMIEKNYMRGLLERIFDMNSLNLILSFLCDGFVDDVKGWLSGAAAPDVEVARFYRALENAQKEYAFPNKMNFASQLGIN